MHHYNNPAPPDAPEDPDPPPDLTLTIAKLNIAIDRLVETLGDVAEPKDAPSSCLLKLGDVAERLNVSERKVESLVANGELRPIRIGRVRRFDPKAVAAFERSRARTHSARL